MNLRGQRGLYEHTEIVWACMVGNLPAEHRAGFPNAVRRQVSTLNGHRRTPARAIAVVHPFVVLLTTVVVSHRSALMRCAGARSGLLAPGR